MYKFERIPLYILNEVVTSHDFLKSAIPHPTTKYDSIGFNI
jgi:hypothetical protein